MIGHPSDVFTFALFIAVAGAAGWLTGRVRDQERLSSRRASAVTALLAASRRLSGVATRAATASALAEQASAAGGGRAVVLLSTGDDLSLSASAPADVTLTTADMTAARWAWEKREAAGARHRHPAADRPGPSRPLIGVRGQLRRRRYRNWIGVSRRG